MSKLRVALALLVAAAPLSGCMQGSPTPAQPDYGAVLAVFNADLGPEGTAVSREEVETIFRDDPELLEAVLNDLATLDSDPADGMEEPADAAS
jgi:hypothetical protein